MKRPPVLVVVSCLALAPISATAQDMLMPAPSTAPCELTLAGDGNVDWNGPYGRGYDVFDETVAFETFEAIVQHIGEPCKFVLTATAVSSGARPFLTRGAEELEYDILRETNGPSILSGSLEGTPSTRITGQFGSGESAVGALLSVYIPPLQFVESGTFDGQFILRLYREDGASLELADERPVTIIAPVAARLRVDSPDFTNGSTTTLIDLGELSDGAREEIAFEIQSNSRVNVALSSANRGELKHGTVGTSIPYRVTAGGELADLSSSTQTRLGSSFTGRTFALEIQVLPGTYPAGEYSDVITMVFTTE